jgi:hypothetical protein
MPFLPYRFWPESWQPLVTVSPWLIAILGPLQPTGGKAMKTVGSAASARV